MTIFLPTFLHSGEWLSYLKHFDVDAKSKNIAYLSDELIKIIQECRDKQPFKVIDDIHTIGIDIFTPNSHEIASDKLELLLYINKEVLLHFERQVLDSKYQMEIEKHIKSSNYLCERLNLIITRRSPITYSINPIAYPINNNVNVPNTYPLSIYPGYGDATSLSGSPSYYVHNGGVNNALLSGFMPNSNSNFLTHLPTTASIPIPFPLVNETPRFHEQAAEVTTSDVTDKSKTNNNRREWVGKRHKKKTGRRQYATDDSTPPPITAQRLNFSQVLQAAEQSQAPGQT